MAMFPALDEQVLERLSRLGIAARHAVESVLLGQHRSIHRGLSVEFAGHRPYQPGDDLRHLDWAVYGRSDRYDVRVFNEETRLRATVVLDCSGSMGYRSNAQSGVNKLDYARTLTAALAFMMLRQTDAVGLVTCDRDMREQIPPQASMSHLVTIIDRLQGTIANGGTRLGAVLTQLATQLKRRGLVVLVSDGFDDPDELLLALQLLRHQRQDVRFFQVLDPHEVAFPFQGMTAFTGLEGEPQQLLDADRIRPFYLHTIREHQRKLAEGCDRIGVQMESCRIDEDLALVLARALSGHGHRAL